MVLDQRAPVCLLRCPLRRVITKERFIPCRTPRSKERSQATTHPYTRFLKTSLYCRVRSSMKACSTATPRRPRPP